MLEKVLNWIKSSMPISRREFERADCDIRRLWAYGACYSNRAGTLEKDLNEVRNEIEDIFRKCSGIDIRVDRLSEVAASTNDRLESFHKRLNYLTTALMSAKPKEITNVDITDIDKLLQRDLIVKDSFKQVIASVSKPKVEPIAKDDDKCPWDLEDHKLGKCVFLTDEEKATLISLLENRCASLGYQSICSADATVMQYCEKNIIEFQTLINKFK